MISEYVCSAWIIENRIKNEKGEPIDFIDHGFLLDIYDDQSNNIVVTKAAQVGLSTLEILKNIHDARHFGMDIIYTLPTDKDVEVFVGGKVNRIIANNPILQSYTIDKDTIEQKQIGEYMVYFRGTWTKKAAIMITADRLVHDEKDSSKQDVVKDYEARLQHSKFKQKHVFSHPSVPNNGVDVEWQLSDQKEWFVRCSHCNHRQFLSWDLENPKHMSIDMERRIFVCKRCRRELTNHDRAVGEWIQKYRDRNWSGYHISLLMASWVSAGEIIDKFLDTHQTTEYFYNKVLGLSYAGSGNSVTHEMVTDIIASERNDYKGRLIIGVDTGVQLRYVLGNRQGLVGYGQVQAYEPDKDLGIPLEQTLEYFLVKFPDSVMIIDQGGDIIGSRKLAKKYPGRVFLCHYVRDRKTMQLIRWGEKAEYGNVLVDRNRMIQLVIDEMREKRWRLFNGDKETWNDYWLHWSHIYRIKKLDLLGIERFEWLRSDRDDWVHATVYWRIGLDRFGAAGAIMTADQPTPEPNSYIINADQTIDVDLQKLLRMEAIAKATAVNEDDGDWRA